MASASAKRGSSAASLSSRRSRSSSGMRPSCGLRDLGGAGDRQVDGVEGRDRCGAGARVTILAARAAGAETRCRTRPSAMCSTRSREGGSPVDRASAARARGRVVAGRPGGRASGSRAMVVGVLSACERSRRADGCCGRRRCAMARFRSAHALAFAARRLSGDPVRFLLATRAAGSFDLERALAPRVKRLGVGPLSLGATRRRLFERLGLALPRRVLCGSSSARRGSRCSRWSSAAR